MAIWPSRKILEGFLRPIGLVVMQVGFLHGHMANGAKLPPFPPPLILNPSLWVRSTLRGGWGVGLLRGGGKGGSGIATSRPHIYALAWPVGGGFTHSVMQGEARTKLMDTDFLTLGMVGLDTGTRDTWH